MPSDPLHVTSPPGFRTSCPLYLWHHRHYLCEYISTIFNIKHTVQSNTTTICEITTSICVASFALYKTSHPHFMVSIHRVYVITPTIFDIVSTVFVSSHPLYWWYHTNCISEISSAIIPDIIYIVYYVTDTLWHQNHCIHDIRFPTYDITSRFYIISSPIPVTSQTLCL